MKNAVLVAAALALAGCAGVNKSMEYSSVKHVTFSDPSLPHGFWIFDKPAEGRMLINQAPGAAAGAGFAKGATLGLVDTSTPQNTFQTAANLWFKSVGRPCTVTRTERILAPTNYEVFYTCTGAAS